MTIDDVRDMSDTVKEVVDFAMQRARRGAYQDGHRDGTRQEQQRMVPLHKQAIEQAVGAALVGPLVADTVSKSVQAERGRFKYAGKVAAGRCLAGPDWQAYPQKDWIVYVVEEQGQT